MKPSGNRHLNAATPHSYYGVIAITLARLLLVCLLAVGPAMSALAQSPPLIQWMRGAIAGTVNQIALSPNGKNIAMCGTDGTTKIRRISDGMLLQTLVDTTVTARPPTVTTLAYTPDGTKLLTGSSASTIHLWNLANGTILSTLATPNPVYSIAISPDGTKFAVGMSGNDIQAWNLADFSPAGTFGGHTSSVYAVAFSADNTKLASGSSDGTIRIWDVPTATTLKILTDGYTVTSVVFSPDNVTVCSGDIRGNINIWNSSTGGSALHSVSVGSSGGGGGGGVGVSIAISPDGTQVTGGSASYTKLYTWRISDGVLLASTDTTLTIASIAYTADGSQIYAANSGNYVSIWSGFNLAAIRTMPAPFISAVTNVAVNPAGTMIANTAGTGSVYIWDTSGTPGMPITPAVGTIPAVGITAFAFSPDGAKLAISGAIQSGGGGGGPSPSYFWIYNISNLSNVIQIRQLHVGVSSLAYTPDGTMLAAGVGNNINLYRLSDMSLIHTLTDHTGSVNGIAISQDGTTLASASSDRTVKTWSLSTFSVLKTLSKHNSSVNSVGFSPDGLNLIDVSSDGTSILWRIADSAVLQTFTSTEGINTAAISLDGKQVTTGSADRHLKIWNAATGMGLFDYTQETGAPPNGVTSVIYSPDGKFIVYGRNDAVLVEAVNPLFVPLITGLSINPSTVVGGSSSTGTVTLNSTTLAGGAVVFLSSDNGAATVPPTVNVPGLSATATFTINTSAVSAPTIVTITASLNGSSATATLTINPPTVLSLSVSPTSVRGGQNSTGTVTLTGPAPAGGWPVPLQSSNPRVAIVPSNVTVAAGATTATFTITTNVVGTTTTVTITAGSATATLTVTPPIITALSTSPANLKGGQPSTGTGTISDPAPTGGITINLASNNASVASCQGSVNVAAGATTATFPITTHTVPAITSVTFTATFSGSSQTTVLTVTPPTVNTLTLNPSSVKGSLTSTGTVTISDPAPTGGISVPLSSSDTTVATVPSSVTVAAGSTTATFPVTTYPVATDTPVVLSAASATGTLTVLAPALSNFALNPTNVRAYSSSSGIVTLDAVAPIGGMPVFLTSSNPSQAGVPLTATVPAGATTVTFPITIGGVTTTTTLQISATLGTVTKTANLVITPNLPFDFDGDGHNDLVFQNSQTGLIAAWFMNGLSVLGASTVSTLPQAGWQVRGAADFNHDGHPDLVLQNATTGQVVFWYLNGTTLVGGEATSVSPGADYKVVGTGDFNGDGNIDLVFQNQKTQSIVFWFMNGAKVIGGATLPFIPSVGYNVVGVGDFNGDGHPDLLFQNQNTGQVVVWYMNGVTFAGGGAISYFPPLAWKVKGVADYNNDGIPDIVFQNSTTNQVLIWFMNGLTVTGGDLISIQPPALYQVVGPH
jgi:WD40 repeat protein